MKKPSKTLLCAGILSAFALFAPCASAAIIAEYNFSSAGDADVWATSSLNITGLAVSTGFLTGTASSNDPQLRITPTVSLMRGASETWSTIVFRVRETQDEDPAGVVSTFDPLGLIVQVNYVGGDSFNTETISDPLEFTAVDSGGGFLTVTMDISSIAADTIVDLRFDPIGGAGVATNSQTSGNSFEIDFIQINAVPEPSAALLGGLSLLALLRRRR